MNLPSRREEVTSLLVAVPLHGDLAEQLADAGTTTVVLAVDLPAQLAGLGELLLALIELPPLEQMEALRSQQLHL